MKREAGYRHCQINSNLTFQRTRGCKVMVRRAPPRSTSIAGQRPVTPRLRNFLFGAKSRFFEYPSEVAHGDPQMKRQISILPLSVALLLRSSKKHMPDILARAKYLRRPRTVGSAPGMAKTISQAWLEGRKSKLFHPSLSPFLTSTAPGPCVGADNRRSSSGHCRWPSLRLPGRATSDRTIGAEASPRTQAIGPQVGAIGIKARAACGLSA